MRHIRFTMLVSVALVVVATTTVWVAGQWYSLHVRLGLRFSTSYGGITIAPDRPVYFMPPSPRFGLSEPVWKQPLWYDEFPRPIFNLSHHFPGPKVFLPYWLILVVSLATLGLVFWLTRKWPHGWPRRKGGRRGFAVQT